ncbi:Protein of unknown function [Bacillus toyonensis]|nr:Protein of unknown function [Bacillus toyonensis]
MFEYEFKLLTI